MVRSQIKYRVYYVIVALALCLVGVGFSFSVFQMSKYGPSDLGIEEFSYSDCIISPSRDGVCTYDSAQVISAYRTDSTYETDVASYANCIGRFDVKASILSQSVVNVEIAPYQDPESGEIEVELCDCLFKFHIKLVGLDGYKIDSLYINGASLEEQNRNDVIEEVVVFDKKADEEYRSVLKNSDKIFTFAESPPVPLLSIDSINSLVYSHLDMMGLDYQQISGVVFFEINVDKDGTMMDHKPLRGINPSFNQVLDAIIDRLDIKFSPALTLGVRVRYRYVLRIVINK